MILTIEDIPARVADVFLMLDETLPHLDRSSDVRVFEITTEEVARWAGLSNDQVAEAINKFMEQGRLDVYRDKIKVHNMTDFARYVSTRRGKRA